MKLYKLDKCVLSLKNSPEKLLNGITSNSLDTPLNAFLDITGRIIVTFEQLKVDENTVYILIEKQFYERLMQHLEKYLRFSKSKIEKEKYNVYFNIVGNYTPGIGEYIIPYKKGQIVLTKKNLQANLSEEEFTLFRLENDFPLQGIDYDRDMLLNVSEDFVSYTKGCYLGQEIISRVHFKSKPPKKLVVRYGDELPEELRKQMTSVVVDKEIDRKLGFVFLTN